MLLLTVSVVILLMLLGVPVAISLATTTIGFFALERIPLETFIQMIAKGVDSFTLLALPFFILTGKLMNLGGATMRILELGNASVGHIRGGMAHANVAASFLFAGVSGSAVADAGGLGAVEIEAMRKAGYDEDLAVGVTAASSTVGPIIPPSVIMIVYGIASGVPIGALFIGGIIPGILMAIALMGMVAFMTRGNILHQGTSFSPGALGSAIFRAGLALLTPAIIVIGILSGVFTVTESGAIAALYSLLLGLIIYRELSLAELWTAVRETMVESAGILLIIGVAAGFAWMMSFQQAPQATIAALLGLTQNPVVILLLLSFVYLLLGLFMEAIAIVTMTIPVVMPALKLVGVDPIHFGVVLAVVMSIGTITPPLGIVMFTLCRIRNLSVVRFSRIILPWIALLVAVTTLLILVPDLVLWLPRVAGLI